ncbi:unnamed protein product [Zymoseptoria tritici ST99CH_3D7]|uniref:Uncharacterized protein n=1 Tax=Zymoseptoria tritici (strain ST99CH_3D7) TaxID=1276538 RepID=A0A1X7RYQ1_ZYMT9|nr:unnamed protein product [Zymoseptoria tritici ST99CH_3D7]
MSGPRVNAATLHNCGQGIRHRNPNLHTLREKLEKLREAWPPTTPRVLDLFRPVFCSDVASCRTWNPCRAQIGTLTPRVRAFQASTSTETDWKPRGEIDGI